MLLLHGLMWQKSQRLSQLQLLQLPRSSRSLRFTNVTSYCKSRFNNTTLQNNRAATELIGKVYVGEIYPINVIENGGNVVVVSMSDDTSGDLLYFSVSDPQLTAKAATIRRNSTIRITAKFLGFDQIKRSRSWRSINQDLDFSVTSIEIIHNGYDPNRRQP